MAMCGLRLKVTSHTVLGIEFLDSPPTLQWTGPSPSPFCRSWSSRRKSSLYSLPLAPWPCIMAKNVPSVVMPFSGIRGFCSGIYEGTKGRRHWISWAHWHHLRGENPLISLCWFVQVWKLRRMASLPSLPVSFPCCPSIGNTLPPRLGSFALLKGPKARSFSIRLNASRFFNLR